MFKMIKNQKGMTLVELLAVMVIVGIIAAISIPAIGSLIDNSRKDAAIATAQAVQDAARLYVTSENINVAGSVTAQNLVNEGYLDKAPTDPVGNTYATAEVTFTVTNGKVTYSTKLIATEANGVYDINGDALVLKRADVTNKVS